MNNDLLNKIKILAANGDYELKKANEAINIGNNGKVRTCARRAAGLYIQAYLTLNEKANYGKSFMNNLRSLSGDKSFPISICNSAGKLVKHISKVEILGEEAIEYAQNIIFFIKNEYLKI